MIFSKIEIKSKLNFDTRTLLFQQVQWPAAESNKKYHFFSNPKPFHIPFLFEPHHQPPCSPIVYHYPRPRIPFITGLSSLTYLRFFFYEVVLIEFQSHWVTATYYYFFKKRKERSFHLKSIRIFKGFLFYFLFYFPSQKKKKNRYICDLSIWSRNGE